jgi:acetyltransferase-like isoleucine patch superfamily enzyme
MNDVILQARHSKDFLSTEDLLATIGQHNTILDASVLISKKITVGHNNTFYPNVVIECREAGTIVIGDNNTFYPGTYILGAGGIIEIAHNNEFGPAGLTIRANINDAAIIIGSGGRYCDGASIMGKTSLGDGSQILGAITVQSCTLGGGGSFQEPDPDQRAAVLKGFGLARGVTLRTGQVVNGAGNFAEAPVQWQHEYHPKVTDSHE